jgi:hypothetical protein
MHEVQTDAGSSVTLMYRKSQFVDKMLCVCVCGFEFQLTLQFLAELVQTEEEHMQNLVYLEQIRHCRSC